MSSLPVSPLHPAAPESATKSEPAKEKDPKALLPMSKIKHIMKLDESIGNVSGEANYAVTVATQLFLELLVLESYQFTLQAGKKTISYQDVASAVNDIHEFEFLSELVPQTMKYEEAIQRRKDLEDLQNAAKEDFAM